MGKNGKDRSPADPTFQQDLGRNNPAFQQTDDIVDAKGHHRRQRRPDYAEESIPAGFSNVAFEDDQQSVTPPPPYPAVDTQVSAMSLEEGVDKTTERETWGNPVEFLMSCIAMSVGLGNVWRFPYVAYKNGGGAFLIPYLVVLLFIGKPLYFLEMALGQFSSYGSVKIWEVVPILKGVGYAQGLATWFVVTYYCVLIAICIYYFIASFQTILPWTLCDLGWTSAVNCYNSSGNHNLTELLPGTKSSSEIYFNEEVMKRIYNIDDGIGLPDWKLSLCLLLAWIIIGAILMKGVATSGKVAYFTALFPYVVLITLLVRGVTLDGADEGILYFIRPQWDKLLDVNTWYAAVGQCFFSLSVGFGPIVMFSSYNQFRQNIYRDAIIISLMDTFTSFLAGITIFSILGNLAHESGKNVSEVVSAGTGLAFVSYPDAIAKFDIVPQLFAVLFFMMMLTLGIGSATSLTGCVITIICDDFPGLKRWLVTGVISILGFFCGLIYVTPGGLQLMDIVGYFGGDFIIFLMVIIEIVGICWIYGLNRFVSDIHFMLGVRLGAYWKLTWAYIIPITLIFIFCYGMSQYEPLGEGDYKYPTSAISAGWVLAAIAVLQVPIWAVYVVYKQKDGDTWCEKLGNSFKASVHWGPKNPAHRLEWKRLQKDEHMSTYSRFWLPKMPSRKTYDVSAPDDSGTGNNNGSPSGKSAANGTQRQAHSRTSWGQVENEIAS